MVDKCDGRLRRGAETRRRARRRVEHRADPRPETVANGRSASDGYVSKATIVAAAKKAGLVLEAESRDQRQPERHQGPPVRRLDPAAQLRPRPAIRARRPAGFDPAKYKAIGESDRHTLRFRKPA